MASVEPGKAAGDTYLDEEVVEDSRAASLISDFGVDVSSTLLTLGRVWGEPGTRSLLLSRMAPSEEEVEGLELSESSSRYEQLRLLGRGGMGQVDQVWDHDLMRKLAVKRLRQDRLGSGIALRQFLWEARVTAYLDHPNIVPVHDLGLDDNNELYFTMKFVHGTSLDELIGALARVEAAHQTGEQPTAVDEVISAEHLTQLRRVRLFLDICQGIAFAHERGVLHRDLKPANVMIGQYGEVLIMDWGLAYPLPGPAGENLRELLPDILKDRSTGKPSGTPRYMSPEQVLNRPLDERSDVYSLGVILYELLTLKSPYSATEFPGLLMQVSEAEVIALTETGPSVPDSLTRVVSRALTKDPDRRYATVRELTEDIEAVLDGVSPMTHEGSAPMAMASPGSAPIPMASAPPPGSAPHPAAQPRPASAPHRAPEPAASPTSPSPLLPTAAVVAGLALGLVLASLLGARIEQLGWPAAAALALLAGGLVALSKLGGSRSSATSKAG